MMPPPLARIALYSLGGTIAMTRQPHGGVAPTLSAGELLAAVPDLAQRVF
jgi:L-asparaginase